MLQMLWVVLYKQASRRLKPDFEPRSCGVVYEWICEAANKNKRTPEDPSKPLSNCLAGFRKPIVQVRIPLLEQSSEPHSKHFRVDEGQQGRSYSQVGG